MSYRENRTPPGPPRWKRALFFAAVLIGLPATGWAFGQRQTPLALALGIVTLFALAFSFSARRCPNCHTKLLVISYAASHCPKCGTPYG